MRKRNSITIHNCRTWHRYRTCKLDHFTSMKTSEIFVIKIRRTTQQKECLFYLQMCARCTTTWWVVANSFDLNFNDVVMPSKHIRCIYKNLLLLNLLPRIYFNWISDRVFNFYQFFLILKQCWMWRLARRPCKFQRKVLESHRKQSMAQHQHSTHRIRVRWQNLNVCRGGTCELMIFSILFRINVKILYFFDRYVNLLEPYMVQLVRLDFGKSCCGKCSPNSNQFHFICS